MKVDITFLRSKVARRIFTLFILCALLPIAALAVVSFTHVTRQLNEQSRDRLAQASKAQGMSILERLRFVEAEMKMIASGLDARSGSVPTASQAFPQDLEERFRGLALVSESGALQPLFRQIRGLPELTDAERTHVGAGRGVVSTSPPSDSVRRVFMRTAADPQEPTGALLLGEVNTGYLWGLEALPALTELSVLDEAGQVLMSSSVAPAGFREQVAEFATSSSSGWFEWSDEREEYLSSYWLLFLKPQFFVPTWTVVLNESKADVLGPTADFKSTFPLVILMAVWVVLLLSLIQIRRNLVPLEKLQEGTRRIAKRDFASRVTVTSGDEFEDLARSFNVMAANLGQQFNALTTINKIDRAILSTLDTEEIVSTVVTQMRRLVRCGGVSVHLFDAQDACTARSYFGPGAIDGDLQVETTTFAHEEVEEFDRHPELLFVNDGETPSYLEPLVQRGMRSFVVLPILLKGRVSALICLGHTAEREYSQEDVQRIRQVADQVAVALSNARLIEELARLNWGTLRALARAIDAKSPWTAGHSERVTEMALRIGRVMNLSAKELDVLHRGGLLHDVGKIGIPPAVLDKPARLTDDESRVMRDHVRIGARILEPIAAFADALPIVLEHHEWFNGKGYPAGRAGEELSLGGRIFAVADVFDAVTTARPYRTGMAREKAVELIRKGSGGQFDPKVVEAFLVAMAQEEDGSPGHLPGDHSMATPPETPAPSLV